MNELTCFNSPHY